MRFTSRTIFGPVDSEPSLPEIPESTAAVPRPSPTPSSILPANGAPISTSNSSFFRRLSAEIQQSILGFAFGNLIVHLELDLEYGRWRLRGFVCSRSPALANDDPDAGPVGDLCLQHLAQIQSLAKKPSDFQDPEKGYQIGAMGWLLSCKQAYMTGIPILYGKNTFHIADKDLSSRLPLFLPSHSLQHITKVEIVLAGVPYFKPQEDSEYHKHLYLLPNTLPHLQDLHISFNCQLLAPAWLAQQPDQREVIENTLLLPVDAMVRKLRSQCRVNIAFPPALWIPMMGRARRRNPNDILVEWAPKPPARPRGHKDRFWRPMPETVQSDDKTKDDAKDETKDETKDKATDEATDNAKDDNSTASPPGYWLETGCIGQLPAVISCFTRAT